MRILKITLAFRLISLELSVCIAAILLCSSPAAGQHKPRIQTVFKTESPLLKITHSKELPGLEQQLSDTLASLGNQYLGFLDWSSKREGSGGAGPTSVLTVVFEEKSADFGGFKTDEFFLRVEGHIDIKGQKEELLKERFYGSLQVLAKDMVKLTQYIQDQLAKWFENPDFLQKITNYFGGNIPISRDAEVLGDDRLGVPLLDSEIRASSSSKMLVRLRSTLGERPADAIVPLAVRSDHVDTGHWYEKVQCRVESLTFVVLYPNPKDWKQIIRPIFKNQVPGTLEVYMIKYDRCIRKTDCSMVVTPK